MHKRTNPRVIVFQRKYVQIKNKNCPYKMEILHAKQWAELHKSLVLVEFNILTIWVQFS
jgi:hypothetical protein